MSMASRRPRRVHEMQLRIGAFEMTKCGGAALDWRDPYYLALAVSWRGFALLFLAAETRHQPAVRVAVPSPTSAGSG